MVSYRKYCMVTNIMCLCIIVYTQNQLVFTSDWLNMTHILFEENKQLIIAKLISSTSDGNHHHIQLNSGKQAKIKSKEVLYTSTNAFFQNENAAQEEIDLELLWECAPEEGVHAQNLALEYFGQDNAQNTYAIFQALHKNPIYFGKKGQGIYQKANREQLNAALQGIEKRKAQEALQQSYIDSLVMHELPDAFKKIANDLLFNPNKNSIEWKACDQAAKKMNMDLNALLIKVGAISDVKTYHEQQFIRANFPQGLDFKAHTVPNNIKLEQLEQNTHLAVFSIDDSNTTEIDDAFSVEWNENGFELGIHIAAPALGIEVNDVFDQIARQRLSTVYLPHTKITMFPPAIVDAFTLQENKVCAAISMYMQVDHQFNISNIHTKVNAIHVKHNLRYDKLDQIITEDAIINQTGDYLYKKELDNLWHFSNHLYQLRQVARQNFGLRPESGHQTDYAFNIFEENGVEKVDIKKRMRGAPLDKIVAELMILANSTWAQQLSDVGLMAMFRTQKSWGTMRTRMQAQIAPHEGLGVNGYVWATSPLRRYADLLNQWQIIAFAQHGNTAKLIAPFNQKDNDIYAILSMFSDTYQIYNEHQTTMERYWCLRWLKQENIKHVNGTLGKEGYIRFVDIPFNTKQPELAQYPRGSIISLELLEIDEFNLDVKVRIVSIQPPKEQ
jgi:exoribonuclease II